MSCTGMSLVDDMLDDMLFHATYCKLPSGLNSNDPDIAEKLLSRR